MGAWAVFKKEMRLYFTSPVAYVVFTFFLLIVGYFFYSIFAFYTLTSMQATMNPAFARDLNITDAIMRPLFSNTGIILLFFMPMLTMRLFAEEKRSGTIELLLTFPVRDGEVLLAKFAAGRGVRVDALTRPDLEELVRDLMSEGRSPRSVSGRGTRWRPCSPTCPSM